MEGKENEGLGAFGNDGKIPRKLLKVDPPRQNVARGDGKT